VTRFKYPKISHLTISPGLQNDDRMIPHLDHLLGYETVATEKRDGENTSLYTDGLHARSLDSRHHPSRDWVKMFHGQIAHRIPEELRICGENMYAVHSVAYAGLKSYFNGFSVWDAERCLAWDESVEWFQLLGIEPVPVIWRGTFTHEQMQKLADSIDPSLTEGFVVRRTCAFDMHEFKTFVAKWVRKGHVQTDDHWMQKEIVPNKLL
jgi:hypothetical protein